MSESRARDRDSDPGPDIERGAGEHPDAPGIGRRRFLAAGLTGAPLILTVPARSVWAKRRTAGRTTDRTTETAEEDSAALSGDPSEAPEA